LNPIRLARMNSYSGVVTKVEPFFCLNMGTGDLREALAWIEYCNIKSGSYYADLRRSHGVEKPHNIKYWALGNEVYGSWQIAQSSKEEYSAKAIQWAKAIKLLDPTIKLILCGKYGMTDWDRYVLAECIEWVDYHSIHFYSASGNHFESVFCPMAVEKIIQITKELIDLARVTKHVEKDVKIAFDEWNIWDRVGVIGEEGCEQIYTVSDMLGVASWLNIFVRHANTVEIACIAQSVNVLSPLLTKPGDILKQTIWWPYLYFSKYMKGTVVSVFVDCDVWNGDIPNFSHPKSMQDLKWVDASATIDQDGYLTIAIVNKETKPQSLKISMDCQSPQSSVEKWEVFGQPTDCNSWENKTKIYPKYSISPWSTNMKLKACSFTLLRMKL